MLRTRHIALFVMLLTALGQVRAQASAHPLDLAVMYLGERSLKSAASQNFWMRGGSIELGADAWRGWGIAAGVTGTHASSIGTSGIPLSLVTVAFGPRYRWHAGRRISIYGQALAGEANGFRSLFPTAAGTQSDANGFTLQLSGGLDCRLSSRFAVRALDVGYVRTTLPNATDNVQNTLRVGGGIVWLFGR